MKESVDRDKSGRTSKEFDEFEKRAERILDRLDKADRILDDMHTEKKKPDKIVDALQEVFDSVERGIKRMFNSSFFETAKSTDGQQQDRSISKYLQSCSDEQLAAVRNEIDKILRERGSM